MTTTITPNVTNASAVRVELDSPAWDELLGQITQQLAQTAAQHDRDGSFPHANFDYLQQHGLLALTVPKALGGYEASLSQTAAVIHAVARGEPSTALVLVMQYLFQLSIARNENWPAHLRERVAAEAVKDGALINALRVEPELGTPARGGLPGTIARRTPEGWRISGTKIYSTGIPRLTWLAVWARSDDADPLVGAWLVHRDTPGITVVEDWDHLACAPAVVIAWCLMTCWCRWSTQWKSRRPASPANRMARSTAGSACCCPPCMTVWRMPRVTGLCNGRTAACPPIWARPCRACRAFRKAGRSGSTVVRQPRRARCRRAGPHPSGRPGPDQIHRHRQRHCRRAKKIAELTGNPGLSRHNPLERHLRDVLCSRIHTPQNDAILTTAGKAAFAAAAAQPRSH